MVWFLVIMGLVFILLFIGICVVDKIQMREEKEPEYHAKWERLRKKTSPVLNLFDNLLGWIFALLVIYYIYLR